MSSDDQQLTAAKPAPAGQMRTRPTRTFSEYFYVLKKRHGFQPVICVDVGAGYGTSAIYSAFPDAFHVVVEPLRDLLPRLRKTMAPYRHRIVNGALLEQEGTCNILKAENLLTSTVMHSRTQHPERVEQIDSYTLDTIMGDLVEPGPVLLKTDCQGSDLRVVKGGTETLKRCDVVIMEVSFFRFWGDHQPDFFDVLSFMDSQGFVVHDFLDGLFRPYDRALAQIDVAFVRKASDIRKYRYWQ